MDTLIPREIAPMKTKLDSLVTTVRSLYSNGSGGPPGYLEMARAEDNERFGRLFAAADTSKENEETFKDFIKSYIAERQARKQRWKQILGVSKIVLPVLGSLLLAFCGFLYQRIEPVVKAIWQEYEHNHPAVTQELKGASASGPALAETFAIK